MRLKRLKISETADLVRLTELARKSTKTPSLRRDLNLLDAGLRLTSTAQCNYDQLFHLAVALGQEIAAGLLEQCRKDMQNAYGYLIQISDNIIYPQAIRSTTSGILTK